MIKTYRHGEILFVETKEIPKEAKLKNTTILMKGSGNNAHSFKGGKFFELTKGIVFGYFEAKNTTLLHKDHGNKKSDNLLEAKLPDGIYELRKGQEFTPDGLKPIID